MHTESERTEIDPFQDLETFYNESCKYKAPIAVHAVWLPDKIFWVHMRNTCIPELSKESLETWRQSMIWQMRSLTRLLSAGLPPSRREQGHSSSNRLLRLINYLNELHVRFETDSLKDRDAIKEIRSQVASLLGECVALQMHRETTTEKVPHDILIDPEFEKWHMHYRMRLTAEDVAAGTLSIDAVPEVILADENFEKWVAHYRSLVAYYNQFDSPLKYALGIKKKGNAEKNA